MENFGKICFIAETARRTLFHPDAAAKRNSRTRWGRHDYRKRLACIRTALFSTGMVSLRRAKPGRSVMGGPFLASFRFMPLRKFNAADWC
jgi:hypothetical protein